MANSYSVLAQSAPAAATLTAAYTVPAATQTIISTIIVCNRSAVYTKFRIAISPDGAAIADQHYLYYDILIPGNDTFAATLGVTINASDVVRVYAQDATLSFNIFGVEIT